MKVFYFTNPVFPKNIELVPCTVLVVVSNCCDLVVVDCSCKLFL